jgi:hypothetical protein
MKLDFCVSHNYTQRNLLLLLCPTPSLLLLLLLLLLLPVLKIVIKMLNKHEN